MSEMRQELEDSARKAFPDWEAAQDHDQAWTRLVELGWFMAGVPEEMGGLGLGNQDLAVIFVELGRALVPGPVLAQFLTIEALALADAFDHRDDLLERAMGGEVMTASLARGGMTGTAAPDADRAAYILDRGDNEVALVALTGADVVQRETWDTSRRLFDVVCTEDAERHVLARGIDAARLNDRLDALLCLALAGDALGGAHAVLDITLEHLQTRSQFDRPLAMFQALKHRAADLKTAIDTAGAFYHARAGDPLDALTMGGLKAHCCNAYRDTAEDAIQLHGGVGLTTEYAVHRFFKRAFLNCALGGDKEFWDERTGRAMMQRT
jgi:alkylation response protein AidB-like acyl-CoA dehydrogenase